jgi:hypothetical protein
MSGVIGVYPYRGLRGIGEAIAPIPYLGEKQIDRGNNDKLQNIISNSGYNVQTSIILEDQRSMFNSCVFIGGVI